jgi:hypothetical protein
MHRSEAHGVKDGLNVIFDSGRSPDSKRRNDPSRKGGVLPAPKEDSLAAGAVPVGAGQPTDFYLACVLVALHTQQRHIDVR